MFIDTFSAVYEYTQPNRDQLLVSVKQIISQENFVCTLNFWHLEKNDPTV